MPDCEIFTYDHKSGKMVVDETLTLHSDNRVTSDRSQGEPTMLTWPIITLTEKPHRKLLVKDDPKLWFFSLPLQFVSSSFANAGFVWEQGTDIAKTLRDMGWAGTHY